MRTTILISIVLTTLIFARAQQPPPNGSVAPAQTTPNANGNMQPPAQETQPPGQETQPPQQDQTTPAAGGVAATNENNFNPGFAATNPAGMEPANHFAETNTMEPGVAAAFALTNRLATMAPAQAQTVVQVQVGLNSLQEIAVTIGPVGNVQEVVMQNAQARQRLHEVSGQIIALARGRARPSFDSADRLAVDLLRACSRARWDPEHQLVLAMIINDACNCENLSTAQLDESVNNGMIVLRAAGVTPAFCNSIGCDLHSIAFEVQPNLAL